MFMTFIRRSNRADGARVVLPTPELDAYLGSARRRPRPGATREGR